MCTAVPGDQPVTANLSAAALNNIYTNLGTGVGAQAITVTGNRGTAGDDRR